MNHQTLSAKSGLRSRPALLALWVSTALSTALGLSAPTVLAQETPTAANTTVNAQVRHYTIPAQPLSGALIQFGQQSGLQVTTNSSLVKGKQATAVTGDLSAEQALNQLLAGTGLSYQFNGGMVSLISGGSFTKLPPVKIGADFIQESAYGPASGFVAKHSATATKTDTPLIETPQSVSVVTAQQIEAQGAQTVESALTYTPSVHAYEGGIRNSGTIGTTIGIRGFNLAPLHIDGQKFPINSINGPEIPYFYERIEILKGPASVLFGQSSPGGIVNLVSKRPTEDPLKEIKVHVGSWDKKQLNFDFGGQATEDGEWGYRLTGLVQDSDTMVDYIADDRKALALATDWQPSIDTTLSIFATIKNTDTSYNLGLPREGTLLPNPGGHGDIPRNRFIGEPDLNFESERQTLSYQFEHRFNDTWSIKQSGIWYNTDIDYAYVGARETNPPDYRTTDRFARYRVDTDDGYSLDSQLQGHIEHGIFQHTILAGLEYTDTSTSRVQRSSTAMSAIDVYDPVYGTAITTGPSGKTMSDDERYGLYLQDHVKINEHWVALFGVRRDKTTSDATTVSPEEKENATTYRAGLLYLFNNGIAPYISYAESFEPLSGTDAYGAGFEPTKGEQNEIGIKYEPNNLNLALTFAVFELKQKNVLTSDPINIGEAIQTGEVTTKGAEIELRTSMTDKLNLIASYSQLDASITKSNRGDAGKRTQNTPENLASVWLDYTWFANLNFGAGVKYVDSTITYDRVYKVPGYTVLDVVMGYQMNDNLEFQFNLNNALDKVYFSSCQFKCAYGNERNFAVSAKYNW